MAADVDDLQALARGDLAAWHGLAEATMRADVDVAFGSPLADVDAPRRLGTWVGGSRRYPGGVEVWFDGDAVVFLSVDSPPAVRAPLDATLGPPEATAPSGLGPSRQQLVWAGRGLAAHVSTFDGGVFRVYGFMPVPVETFLEGALAHVSIERRSV